MVPGLRKRLHAGGDVDTVTVDVSLVDDDVADIDADAELDPAILRNGCIAFSHGTLDFHGATGCVDRTRKFDQSAVARGFDHTAAMFRNLGIDQFAAASLERCESTFLVSTHQAAIACNISSKNCC